MGQIMPLLLIDDSYKTTIQPTNTKLNMADRSLILGSGMTALHLRIVDFKFTHNYQPLKSYLQLIYRRNSHYHMSGIKKNCYIQKWQISHIH